MIFSNSDKKTDAKETCGCGCGCGCGKPAPGSADGNQCCGGKASEGSIEIKVLGSGCKNCHTLFENTKEAVKALGLEAQVEYITDLQKVMEYGVMTMPVLVVNEKVVSAGKVLKPKEIEQLLR